MVKQVRAARHYQHPRAPLRQIATAGARAVKASLRDALAHLPTLIDMERATFLGRSGRYLEVPTHAIDWHHFRRIMRHPFERLARLYEAGAALGARKINGTHAARGRKVRFKKGPGPRVMLGGEGGAAPDRAGRNTTTLEVDDGIITPGRGISKAAGDVFTFDRFSQETQDKLRRAQDDLIQQLEASARDTIQAVVMNGVRNNLTPDAIVRDIRDVIGLTDNQAMAVLNYEAMLRDLDPTALARQLRSMKYDQAVRDAIDDGVPLDEVAIQEMVSAYENNYLDYRADMIAQTESVRMANTGLQDAYQQAIDGGALPSEAVRQFWQVAADDACEICLSIPDQNPDGVAIDESFASIDGPQDAPPDPHPNCRCSLEVVTDLDLVSYEEEENAA